MKLFYKPGACSLAPHIALLAAGVDFDAVKVDTDTKTTEDGASYLDITPKGYVPALQLDSGEVLTEAPAILQYIADQNPEADLAPANGTLDRARAQSYLNFVASEVHKAYGPFFAATPLSDEARPTAEAGVAKRLNIMEAEMADDRTYLLGDKFSVADCYFWVVINWSNFIGIDLGNWPKVKAYWERVSALPALQTALKAEGLA
ncbi:MAG: glutathione transferase GstA [Sphingomonadales bacterium]|jgi:glutathione S-transferase